MKAGKHLNDVVKRIERALGQDAEVTANAKLDDVTTGHLTEVDVLVRGKTGSQPITIMMECRDHKRPVTKQYVDEVHSKRNAVRANKAVIISCSGFSNAAILKAAHLGIGLMTVDEAMNKDWSDWLLTDSVTYLHIHQSVNHVEWKFADENVKDFPPGERRGWPNGKHASNEPCIFSENATTALSINDAMDLGLKQFPVLVDSLLPNAPPVTFQLPVILPPGLGLQYLDGRFVGISLVQLHGTIELIHRVSPLKRFEYAHSRGEHVAKYAEANIELLGVDKKSLGTHVISLVKGPEGDTLTLEPASDEKKKRSRPSKG